MLTRTLDNLLLSEVLDHLKGEIADAGGAGVIPIYQADLVIVIAAARRALDSDRRIQELLESNNATLEKYRAMKRQFDDAMKGLAGAALFCGTMGRALDRQDGSI